MPIIYKTTCLINGKIYVGQSRENNNYYLGSGRLFLKALKKYGRTNFKKEVLIDDINLTKEEIDLLEIKFIREYNSTNREIGYNLDKGGSGNSEIQNKKISESQNGKIISEETKKKISESNKGKKHNIESKNKMSKSRIGNKNRLGKKFNDEDKIKISKALKEHYSIESNRIKSSNAAKKRIEQGKCLEGVNIINSKENQIYATECARIVNSKKINILNLETNESITFNSLNECRLFFNLKGNSQLIYCLKNNKLYKKVYKLKYNK